MKVSEIRGLDGTEIGNKLKEMDDVLFRIKFQMSMGQMEGLKKSRAMKKERARMLTILRERELAEAKK